MNKLEKLFQLYSYINVFTLTGVVITNGEFTRLHTRCFTTGKERTILANRDTVFYDLEGSIVESFKSAMLVNCVGSAFRAVIEDKIIQHIISVPVPK